MTVTPRTVGGVAILDLAGRMMSTDGAGLLKAAVERLVAEGRTQVILNLSELSYVDSGGLGEMLACYATVTKAGGNVKLAHTTARIQDLLAITKLVTVFDCHDTEAQALESFAELVAVRANAAAAKA